MAQSRTFASTDMTISASSTAPRRRAASLPRMQVERATLPSEIYRRLKSMILDGGLKPGELVTIQSLSDAFGVSAMPVREALQRLTGERALTVISGRSVGIPELAAARLRDLSKVRMELEGTAAAWAATRITAADCAKLEALVAAMGNAADEGDTRSYVRANHDFHFTIYGAAGSETLLSVIEALWLQVSPYFHLLHRSGNYVDANEQHRLALRALRRADAKSCGKHIRQDIDAATKVLLRLLAEPHES
jgi:DNA-binding GntR family transcriptional regulator